MKKFLLFITICLLHFSILQAQDFQGKAIYHSKTSVADFNFGGREMSEEQKKRITERLKEQSEKTFILTFDKTAAIYEEEEKLETPGRENGGRGRFRFGDFSGGKLYKNIKDQNYAKESEMFGKVFLIKDDLKQLNWTMGSETKKIGNYTCYKATAIQAIDSTDFQTLRRKRDQERRNENTAKKDTTQNKTRIFKETEAVKEIEITAWFTPEIPVSQGPGEYWGLPGLILEVNAGNTVLLCTKIVLNADEKVEIKAPAKGKVISQQEYNETLLTKMEEMSERFRGGNRGPGGNSNRGRN
ncbi:GLPGLI family protein [Cellulophaga sp. HaHa_2_95]|uniref:GLPGLI family protein n=1 Tax=unclassified Cellulophaga TaxID=2634405 RepID=UPI001C4FF698|nr:GLPGLI family protein [Cellulophaga sp. HaHa_2_95]QXP56014.1 GLPGLI family protein [Cellulophaga sp. HaHa_2_95]